MSSGYEEHLYGLDDEREPATLDLRALERRQAMRREHDRQIHYATQSVLAAAINWRGALGTEDADERIRTARALRDAVDVYNAQAEAEPERGATTIEWAAIGTMIGVALVPTTVLGVGTWGRWWACVAALVAAAVLLVKGERRRASEGAELAHAVAQGKDALRALEPAEDEYGYAAKRGPSGIAKRVVRRRAHAITGRATGSALRRLGL